MISAQTQMFVRSCMFPSFALRSVRSPRLREVLSGGNCGFPVLKRGGH